MEWQSLTEKLFDKMQGWATELIAMLPNLAIAAAILVAGWFVSGMVSRVVRSGLSRLSENEQVNSLAARTARIALFLGAIFIALGVLNLDKTVTSLLAGVGVVGVALGFAFQDIASNFMAGILMAFRRPLHIGDLVSTNGTMGTVIDIDLRATTVEMLTGEHVLIPNKDVFGNAITNFTRTPSRRVDVSCGVAYGTDLRKVITVAKMALDDVPKRDKEREIKIAFTGFGGSSVDFRAQIWLGSAAQPDYTDAVSEAVIRLHEAFDSAGIEIPFPIRTLKVDGCFRPVMVDGDRFADAAEST